MDKKRRILYSILCAFGMFFLIQYTLLDFALNRMLYTIYYEYGRYFTLEERILNLKLITFSIILAISGVILLLIVGNRINKEMSSYSKARTLILFTIGVMVILLRFIFQSLWPQDWYLLEYDLTGMGIFAYFGIYAADIFLVILIVFIAISIIYPSFPELPSRRRNSMIKATSILVLVFTLFIMNVFSVYRILFIYGLYPGGCIILFLSVAVMNRNWDTDLRSVYIKGNSPFYKKLSMFFLIMGTFLLFQVFFFEIIFPILLFLLQFSYDHIEYVMNIIPISWAVSFLGYGFLAIAFAIILGKYPSVSY